MFSRRRAVSFALSAFLSLFGEAVLIPVRSPARVTFAVADAPFGVPSGNVHDIVVDGDRARELPWRKPSRDDYVRSSGRHDDRLVLGIYAGRFNSQWINGGRVIRRFDRFVRGCVIDGNLVYAYRGAVFIATSDSIEDKILFRDVDAVACRSRDIVLLGRGRILSADLHGASHVIATFHGVVRDAAAHGDDVYFYASPNELANGSLYRVDIRADIAKLLSPAQVSLFLQFSQ